MSARRCLSPARERGAPGREGQLLISDAAINIATDLMTKADIVQNAIDLAQAKGQRLVVVGGR